MSVWIEGFFRLRCPSSDPPTVWNELPLSANASLIRFFPICNNIFPIIDQCRCFFTSAIRPWFSNFYWATQYFLIRKETMGPSTFEIWNKNIFSCVAKMSFLQSGRWRFLAILVSDTKMSKLTVCFSILLFILVALC